MVSPFGKITQIHGVTNFCKMNNIKTNKFYAMLKGRKAQYKGWTKYHKKEELSAILS